MPAAKLIHALVTDTGHVRSQNEDVADAAPNLGAYVVCDGMGGAAGGEVASGLAVETFLEHLHASEPASDGEVLGGAALNGATSNGVSVARVRPGGAFSKPQTRLHAAVYAANLAVLEQANARPELAGMGTTMVALLHVPGPEKDRRSSPRSSRPQFVTPPTLFLANVGDSRCYRWRGGELLQLSTDHSFVEEQVLAGQITADQAAVSPMRHYITRAIGSQPHIEPDIQSYRPQIGDLYLLATDGLTRELPNSRIAELLRGLIRVPAPSAADLEVACQGLVDAANESGGRDNITLLLLAFG